MRVSDDEKPAVPIMQRFLRHKAPFTAFLAYCALVRAARASLGRHRPNSGVLVARIRPDWHPTMTGATAISFGNREQKRWTSTRDEFQTIVLETFVTKDVVDEKQFTKAVAEADFTLVIASTEEFLPRAVTLSADWIVDVNAPTDDHFRAACKLFMDRLPTDEEVVLLGSTDPADLEFTMRRGRRLTHCLERLIDDRRRSAAAPISNKTTTKLSDLFGFGPAAAWGRQLAADLVQWKAGTLRWEDVDRGLLLSGLPGTGKTTYARALANECKAHLEIASLARWQAKGHLGDLLKAMRNSFANARRNSPSILFIDEIDAIGDRDAFAGHNAQYCTEVVNALLECLDGLDDREGVVVLGACNNARRLDFALRRSGRLDQHIRIDLPDPEARCRILAHHLNEQVDWLLLKPIIDVTEGWSGADLERLGRLARRKARSQGAQLSPELVLECVPLLPDLTEDERYRIAVHEAGHAIIGVQLSGRRIMEVSVRNRLTALPGQTSLGVTRFVDDPSHVILASDLLNAIATTLAGGAAEEVVFGERSAGAGGSLDSDLAKATELAWDFHARYGFGKSMAYFRDTVGRRPTMQSPNPIESDVEQTIREQHEAAKSHLQFHRSILDKLVHELVTKGKLNAEEVDYVFVSH